MGLDLQHIMAYLPMDRRQAIVRQTHLPDRTRGAALFADISGFTPLTEVLVQELGRQRSIEELTRQLNAVYTALIEQVHRYRGSVISFSGDAITCWFDGDEGIRAVACALAMQQVMTAFAQIKTPAGTPVPLAIKVAVTTGPVRRFLVGDSTIQYIDVLAGATLDDMAAAEKHAQKGEIILAPAIMSHLQKMVTVSEWREDESGQEYAVLAELKVPVTLSAPWEPVATAALTPTQIRPWLLPPIYNRLRQTGQSGFLAELRPGVTLFLRFRGLDYDGDDTAGEKLDVYIRWVQNILGQYEAYLLQLTVGDKGSYLYAAFGAPTAHDDDAVRAVAAALELRSLPAEMDFITQVQIGVSQGRMRTGAYGGQTRRTYGVLGDEVTTSARLMEQAAPGQILVSQPVVQSALRHYDFKSLGRIQLKGKKEPHAIFEVAGRRQPSAQRPLALFTNPLVGRDEDLAQMMQWLEMAQPGQGQIVRVVGAAGIGKSHLAAEFSERAIDRGFQVVMGTCRSANQGTPYYPWRQIFRVFFGLTDDTVGSESLTAVTSRQITKVEQMVQEINPDWQLRLPLLGDLLGLPIPDNAATAAFDPRLRQEALFALAVEIVQLWAQRHSLLILLEDLHWVDETSQGLLLDMARVIVTMPVLLILVHRPSLRASGLILPELASLPTYHHVDLGELSPAGISSLVANRLAGTLSPLALSLIQTQAQGNPFFVEELSDALCEEGHLLRDTNQTWTLSKHLENALRDANCLVRQGDTWLLADKASLPTADLGIPDSIHGIVLSRIDRLPETHKLTLKVASVIGRTFEFLLLHQVHPAHPVPETLLTQVESMEKRDFVRQEIPPPQLAYIFKHNTTQEVTYDTLLFAQRRALHRTVARWYETTFGDAHPSVEKGLESSLAPYYALLAYHWRQAEDAGKECHYAGLAAAQAAAQFANEDAIVHFNRALDLTPERDKESRYQLLLGREAVYGLLGQRDAQASDLVQLQTLANEIEELPRKIEIALRFASYYEAISNFNAALLVAQQAVEWVDQIDDPRPKVEGLTIWGQALWRRGDYQEARQQLNQALLLAQQTHDQIGEAKSLHQLGTVMYYLGDRQAARDYLEQARTIRQQLGDKSGEAGSRNNLVGVYYGLGDFAQAMRQAEKALAIYQEIGLRRYMSTALNNLGAMKHIFGDFEVARGYHERALTISQALDDKQGESVAATNLGWVLHQLGDHEQAQRYCEQALQIREAIGDRNGQGHSLSYLAAALEASGQLIEAGATYAQALRLRREIGQPGAAVDDLSGLARVSLKQGQPQQALTYIEEALQWIDDNGTKGVLRPLQVYLTGVDILQATGQAERASHILNTAHQLLLEQADRFRDENLRRDFLEKVPLHSQLLARLEQE